MSNAFSNGMMSNNLQGGRMQKKRRAKGGVALMPILASLASNVAWPLIKHFTPKIIEKIRSKIGVGMKKRRRRTTTKKAAGTRKKTASHPRAAGYKISGQGRKKRRTGGRVSKKGRRQTVKSLTPF